MPKRENRLRAIDHERRQLDMLKTLTPNATPPQLRALSNRLIDLAMAALEEVYALEDGQPAQTERLGRLIALAERLPQAIRASQE